MSAKQNNVDRNTAWHGHYTSDTPNPYSHLVNELAAHVILTRAQNPGKHIFIIYCRGTSWWTAIYKLF